MKLLLFDLDGTLVRAGGCGRRALNRAIYDVYGVRSDCGAMNLAGKTDLRNFADALANAGVRRPGRRGVERVHQAYLRCLPRYVGAAVRGGKYRTTPGIRGLLKRLSSEEGVILALGTGNMERGARIKLEHSGLNPYFEFGGFGSDAYTRPALLRVAYRRARRRLNGEPLSPRDVYVIGDTPLDVAAGKKAGFKTVAVGTGFSDWDELARSRPDHLAKDFRRTELWLKWLGIKRSRKRSRSRPRAS